MSASCSAMKPAIHQRKASPMTVLSMKAPNTIPAMMRASSCSVGLPKRFDRRPSSPVVGWPR